MIRPRVVFPRALVFAVVAGLFVSACGGESSTEPEADSVKIADLVGSWRAASLVFTNQVNPAQTFDVVAAGGAMRTTVLNHGGARIWLDLGDFSDEWDAQLTLNGNTLTQRPVEASRPTRQ